MLRNLCLAIALLTWFSGQPISPSLKVTHKARSLQPGEIVLVTAEASQPMTELRALAFGHEFPMFAEESGPNWTGLIGIDLDTKPGTYEIALRGRSRDGAEAESAEKIVVSPKSFPTRELTVDEKFVTPPAEVLGRIKEESEKVRAVLETVTPQRYWLDEFTVPVTGPAISAFGKRSVYNGQRRSAHTGTDFRAATGTPVRAPNAGRIALAENLYYSGKTVIIDHGLGLFSYLGHLSSISVKPGALVEAGQVVGKAGATGLVTGPHLHWAVRVAGTRVDPLSLLSLLGRQRGPEKKQ